ncbi:Hemerythrin HHE cation binding domain-containing protein [Duganella sp. CF458]|uniref:hemerythrin domain-containing protein n=1 Tax=Duganella sp. CF458 TaxID=1884368 RepID=UPI0008EE8DA0|nr:hemerythrin domain-containing protein [Duganella sp. CF458]SFF94258.1 Hemerythrin HHE cation binding domain-containing protein [Duganella sp. CF458]
MLTATYTLVALSVEQANVRLSLLSFQKYVQSTLLHQQRLSLSQLEYACETLERLYQACHWRKIELYLIPALQNATEQANQLLDELSRLNQSALSVIRQLQAELDSAVECSEQQVREICESIETFCTVLLQRLEKEEKELFAIARATIGGEAWFDIANKFLAHDAQVVEARRVPASAEKDRKALSQAKQVRASLQEEDRVVVPVPKLRYHRRTRSAHRAAADTA